MDLGLRMSIRAPAQPTASHATTAEILGDEIYWSEVSVVGVVEIIEKVYDNSMRWSFCKFSRWLGVGWASSLVTEA